MQTKPGGVLPSASGYQVYNALNTPIYAKAFLARFYADSIAGSITSQDIIPAELKRCGDQVTFRVAPVGEIFDYINNQDLEVSTLSTELKTMVVKRGKYWNLKLSYVDEQRTCNIKEYINEFMENSTLLLRQHIDREILTEVPLLADPFNKGIKAGIKSGAYNLGQLGQPVALNKETILTKLSHLSTVLDEQNVPEKGRYVVLPTMAKTLFYTNPLLNNACAAGTGKAILLSQQFLDVAGFKVYFTNNMPMYFDPMVNQQTFLILAGFKEAVGFITQLTNQEVIEKDPRSFDKYWRGLTIYDFDVLTPEKLAVLYATIEIE